MEEFKILIERYTQIQKDIEKEKNINNEELNSIIDEIIKYAKKDNAFEEFSQIIEELDSDVFNKLISDLDCDPNAKTLLDIFDNYNDIHKCNFVIPKEALALINIKF